MAMHFIYKQYRGNLLGVYRVPIPERGEKYGYRTQITLRSFSRAQTHLRQNGYTWASITTAESDITVPVDAVECTDIWDFYRKSHWDYRAKVFCGLGDWW